MSFVPVKSDDGAVLPWEYLPAKEDTYACGQMVGVNAGQVEALASGTATPPYLCMANQTVAAKGELLPVVRVGPGNIFETTLSEGGSVHVGSLLAIDTKGLGVEVVADGNATGTFEVVSLEATGPEGAAKGDTVRGKFV